MNDYNRWYELANSYYHAWKTVQGALDRALNEISLVRSQLNAARVESDELKKTIAFLQQSLDEATARNNKPETPNLLFYPVRKLGKTNRRGFNVGDVVAPTKHPRAKYAVSEVDGEGNIVGLNGLRQRWLEDYTWERVS